MAESEVFKKYDNLIEMNWIKKTIKKFLSKPTLWPVLLYIAGVKKRG